MRDSIYQLKRNYNHVNIRYSASEKILFSSFFPSRSRTGSAAGIE
ncbi:hypothetical protein [Mongoliibacter sp.]|nr:hypothetical protein [Mongoliibacter sp.]